MLFLVAWIACVLVSVGLGLVIGSNAKAKLNGSICGWLLTIVGCVVGFSL